MSDNKEYFSITQENGTIQISEEVIATIAALAANEVEGVCGLSANFSADIAELLGRKNLRKGVKLKFSEDTITVDCFVVAVYGHPVMEIARNVQEKVTTAIESMTGQNVLSVNVEICGIAMPKNNKQ